MQPSSLLNDAPSGPALWRSGDAADCKSVYTGSIPVGASRLSNHHSNPPQPARRPRPGRPRSDFHDFEVVNTVLRIFVPAFSNRLQPVNQFEGC